MEHVCIRCTRLSLNPRASTASTSLASSLRSFSTSRISYDQGDQNPPSRSPPQGQTLDDALRKPTFNRTATSSPAGRTGAPRPGQMLLRKVGGDASTPNIPMGTGAGARTRTSTGPRAPGPPGQLLQRTRAARPGSGRDQRQGGAPLPRRGPSNEPPPVLPPGGRRTDKRVRRLAQNRASSLAEEEDPTAFEAEDLATRVERYINTIVDPPPNPTTELPHVPGKSVDTTELRKDWPNTPLSNEGLIESVQQRIEWLAHRLPHGYQTPNQLAQHFKKGYLTRFESEAERDQVLPIAQTLAQQAADRFAEKHPGETVETWDMGFDDVVGRAREREGLANTWVRGVYPEVAKQKFAFLEQIVRNLSNNPTVPKGKKEAFIRTVQDVIVNSRPQGAQAQNSAEKRGTDTD